MPRKTDTRRKPRRRKGSSGAATTLPEATGEGGTSLPETSALTAESVSDVVAVSVSQESATAAERPTPLSAAEPQQTPVPPTAIGSPDPALRATASGPGVGLASGETESENTTTTPPKAQSDPPPEKPRSRGETLHLGAMLVEQKMVNSDQLKQAMERQKRTRRRLGRVLVEMGFTTPEAVLEALSAQLGVPSTRVNSFTVNPDAVKCLSEKVARKHTAFPLIKVGATSARRSL